ncbi:MAG: hypothetical protein K2N25_09830 [Muribaculaceae bacterium]|nr:hypothetical protein [Muribaculaceae bacterium]
MKKSLLFSFALLAGSSAFAAAPVIVKADVSDFKSGPKPGAGFAKNQAFTRADGDMESYYFSYANELYSAFKLGDALTGGVSRVYLAFEMTDEDIKTYAGSKVTGFSVYSPTNNSLTNNSISQANFFYSTDPKLGHLDYTQDFTMSKTPFGLNKVAVDEAYTITGDEEALFFGYSFVVPPNNDMYYVPVDAVPTVPTAGLFGVSIDGESFPESFESFSTSDYGALCMGVLVERETLPKSVSFTTFPADVCLPLGEAYSFPVTLNATCGTPIESVDIEYTLGGNTNDCHIELANPIPAGAAQYFSVSLPFPAMKEKFIESVEFKLTKINGVANDCNGMTAEATVVIVDEVPVHQTLYEEYTGTWCGYCPRGFAALEYISKNYPDFVTASFHYGYGPSSPDPMQVLNFYPSDAVSSFPSAVLNRMEVVDPYEGTGASDLPVPVVGDILALNAIPTAWKINISHEWESDDVLVAKAEVANMAGFNNKTYKIAYLLVADGLSGKSSSWAQSNNYATQTPQYVEELNAFCRRGEYGKSKVAGLVFNDVVISSEGVMGEAGSIPASLEPEAVAQHVKKFDLSKIKAALLPDKNKLRIIAAVVDASGEVLNCAKNEVNDCVDSAVDGVFDDNAPVEYFNLNGMKVAQPSEGIFIRRQGGKADKVIIR